MFRGVKYGGSRLFSKVRSYFRSRVRSTYDTSNRSRVLYKGFHDRASIRKFYSNLTCVLGTYITRVSIGGYQVHDICGLSGYFTSTIQYQCA